MRGANFAHANLRGANFRYADLRGADLDYSVLPLWCGSLDMIVDERLIKQITYHLCSLVLRDYKLKESFAHLITEEIIETANEFHRVDSLNVEKLEVFE